MNRAVSYALFFLLIISGCFSEEYNKTETMATLKLLEKAKSFTDKKNLLYSSYDIVRIYMNTTKTMYTRYQCEESSLYEKKVCRKKIKNTKKYKERIRQSKVFPDLQAAVFLEQYIKNECAKSSTYERCKKNLFINSKFFSHIDDKRKIHIIYLEDSSTSTTFLRKIILLIYDGKTNEIIGYDNIGGV